MKHIATYKNRNTISYSDAGRPDGFPVLVQHGLIASIDDDYLFTRLADAGARVISIARPGYGASDPYPMHSIGEWGEMASTVVDELGLAQFDVFGISSGAPYSYAIGYHLAERVRNLFILSGTPALYEDAVLACWPYPSNRGASIAELQKLARELFFSNVTDEDRAVPEVRDSMMHDCFGIAQDLRLRVMDWGFRLEQVEAPVYLRHSRSEEIFAAVEISAKHLPNGYLEVRENDPHFSPAVLDDFIETVMAKHY